jgi:hypothetical protein
MLSNRILLPLAVALFLSTLASANSTNVTTANLYPGADADNHTRYFSTVGEKISSSTLVAQTSRSATASIGNPGLGAAFSGKVMAGGRTGVPSAGGFAFLERMHGRSCCQIRARNWVGSGHELGSKPALSTPEPGSLMLLSTGLMGIAGMVRRKLLRA